MLGDQDAVVSDQLLGSLAFLRDIKPAVGVLNFHSCGRAYASCAEEEGCESGDNLSIRISADITDLSLLSCDLAAIDHLVELETGNNTGDITSFIDSSEIVVHVLKACHSSLVAGSVAELYVRILFRCADHIVLVTEAVCEYDLAALLSKVCSRVKAGLVLRDVGLLDDLLVGKSESLFHLLDALHVGLCVAFVLITDIDHADFDRGCVSSLCSGSFCFCLSPCLSCLSFRLYCFLSRSGRRSGTSAAGKKSADHSKRQNKSDQFLFHIVLLSW